MDRLLQTFSALVCAVCGFLWGRLDGLLYALIAFMVIDYITGLISAYIRRELSSAFISQTSGFPYLKMREKSGGLYIPGSEGKWYDSNGKEA